MSPNTSGERRAVAIGFLERLGFRSATNGASAPAPERKGITFAPDFIPRDNQGHTIEVDGESVLKGRIGLQNVYIESAYIYAAIHWRAWKYAEAPLFVARTIEDGEEWLPDHPVQELLDEPSPDFDQGELLRLTRMYRDLTGMCLWRKELNGAAGIARLTPYDANEFKILDDAPEYERIYGGFRVYTQRQGGRASRKIPMEEGVLFRETNPYDWFSGVAPARVALEAAIIARRTSIGIDDVIRNAAFRSAMITTRKEWDPDEDAFRLWNQQLKAAMKRHNKGDPFVAHGAERVIPVSMNMQELAPAEVLDRVEAVVASVFGVPAVVLQFLVGLKNSPWSQMSEARRMAIEDVIEPMWTADSKALTRQLLHAPIVPDGQPIEPDKSTFIGFDTQKVRGLQRDLQVASQISSQNADIWTINERRVYTGMEPIEGGDVIASQAAVEPPPAEDA